MPSAAKMVGDNRVTISLYVRTEAPPTGCWERLPIRTTLDQMELERSPNCLFQIEDKLQLTVQYQLKIIWDCESRKACVYIRQFASSLPSLQSESPSHLHFL